MAAKNFCEIDMSNWTLADKVVFWGGCIFGIFFSYCVGGIGNLSPDGSEDIIYAIGAALAAAWMCGCVFYMSIECDAERPMRVTIIYAALAFAMAMWQPLQMYKTFAECVVEMEDAVEELSI